MPPTFILSAFLSTLSLRRATGEYIRDGQPQPNFYPRSPCGERPAGPDRQRAGPGISIHALLAESDYCWRVTTPSRPLFLSTLSLRRATTIFAVRPYDAPIFLSTLSLRRATVEGICFNVQVPISIHALLAESDDAGVHHIRYHHDFYPRSPCGERPPEGTEMR